VIGFQCGRSGTESACEVGVGNSPKTIGTYTVPHDRASHPAGQATHQNNTSTSMRYNLIKTRKQKRSETPPEAMGSSDEARYAEQEKRAAKRADYDMDYKEYSSIKSFSD
jgi:hypothetical protein